MITQKKLKDRLQYVPETGDWCWKTLNKMTRKEIKVGDKAGSVDKNGYLKLMIDGQKYSAHRLAFLYMEGYFPENFVDHINRDTTDNRWCNLREVSTQCNMRNSRLSKLNTSGAKGVSLNNKNNWVANITINRERIYLGVHPTKDSAVRARYKAELKYGWPDCETTSTAYLYLKNRCLINE